MRRRPSLARAWIAFVALLAAGCQDYNFNPVGHCLLQPGSERITLSNLSTADILFVVDDSGSMDQEQARLAANFDTFVNILNQTNVDRIQVGLEPLDFHIAITSSSVYQATTPASCRTDCSGASGALQCCTGSGAAPILAPVFCDAQSDCRSGFTCKTGCGEYPLDQVCCSGTNLAQKDPVTCDTAGEACGDIREHYRASFTGCDVGVGVPWARYPQGDFVAKAGTANPRVISFGKELYPPEGPNTAAIAQRIQWFKENIVVGTCGSGTEQALEAGRLAIKKALRQDGLSQPEGVTGWPHEGAKLVVVFVGDEDDCSAPRDSAIYTASQCPADTTRRFPISQYRDFLLSLDRPVSAAFIESTSCNTEGVCAPNVCCGGTGNACDGSESGGFRFVALADELSARDVDVVEGSICSDFGTLLGQVAELVKPPAGLVLPTQPANTDIAVLRVVKADGATRTTCVGPAPDSATFDQARTQYDWWFTASDALGDVEPSAASRFVYINHETGGCAANPGETYSADYLGVVPAGGCADAAECALVLGGEESAWACEKAPGQARGTCLCQ